MHTNNIHIFQLLRENDLNFNLCDGEGNTCLHYATQFGSLEMAVNLLQSGVMTNIPNNEGK